MGGKANGRGQAFWATSNKMQLSNPKSPASAQAPVSESAQKRGRKQVCTQTLAAVSHESADAAVQKPEPHAVGSAGVA